MFTDLFIKNFEIHKKSNFLFTKGLNILVGPSDSGKSSIVRVFEWFAKNRPTGDSFKRKENARTEAQTTFNGVNLQRIKEKGLNAYIVNDRKLTHIGTEVPSEVSDLLNLGEENIQTQDEFFFLLSDSPGQVAKKFNEIGGLNIMDSILKDINTDIRKLNDKRKAIFKIMDKAKAAIDNLSWVHKAELSLSKIEKLEKKNKERKKKIEAVKNVLSDLDYINHNLSQLLDPEVEKEFLELSKKVTNNQKLFEKIQYVQNLLDDLEKATRLLNQIEIPDIEPLLKQHKKASDLKEKIKRVERLVSEENHIRGQISIISETLETEEKKYSALLKKLGKCPTCGSKI